MSLAYEVSHSTLTVCLNSGPVGLPRVAGIEHRADSQDLGLPLVRGDEITRLELHQCPDLTSLLCGRRPVPRVFSEVGVGESLLEFLLGAERAKVPYFIPADADVASREAFVPEPRLLAWGDLDEGDWVLRREELVEEMAQLVRSPILRLGDLTKREQDGSVEFEALYPRPFWGRHLKQIGEMEQVGGRRDGEHILLEVDVSGLELKRLAPLECFDGIRIRPLAFRHVCEAFDPCGADGIPCLFDGRVIRGVGPLPVVLEEDDVLLRRSPRDAAEFPSAPLHPVAEGLAEVFCS